MRLISFSAFRSLYIPGVQYLKTEHYLRLLHHVREADIVLYPEYWQLNSLVYGLKRCIFPSPASYRIGHDKIEQIRAFLSVAPYNVPWTEILPSTEASNRLSAGVQCHFWPEWSQQAGVIRCAVIWGLKGMSRPIRSARVRWLPE